ncbi:Na/Pi cotransporter family protein [Eubacterium multiforme]|uniref:Phosphate:Na+ symporter n=1 Tax=Eubacterium multiforme TaxID=83339 RepID=A0ABT9UY38_9FIRM|nr:Na/Pi cotransporter family protein [Eubacterium multiforme]MDQ0151229.1 phosphate:Na+ symporter [Eubacterium multiforme]
MEILGIISGVIGGLGLFLYGMKLMGDGLENAAGEKLKGIVEKFTSNRFIGVLVGALVTAIIQSSSATTVMVVSFVNAGIMNLIQATGVIMGANIGTTITAQMVSFNLESIAPLVIGLGVFTLFISKSKKRKEIANILVGFGILFLGMGLMSNAMEPIAKSQFFKDFVFLVGNNVFLGILTGLVMTAIVQSSSATTGILIALSMTGSINLYVALPIILGCNIGTCVTALLAAIGANRTAKKAAIIHLLFNVIGTIIFIPFIGVLIKTVQYISPDDIPRQVANAHTIFNVTVTAILLPFVGVLVLLANKILPDKKSDKVREDIYLDKKLLDTPVIATVQAQKATVTMAYKAKKNFENAMKAFNENNEKLTDEVMENEKVINSLERDIADYLIRLSEETLSDELTNDITSAFNIINDIERIGDHAKNISELAREKIYEKIKYDDEDLKELNMMYESALKIMEMSIKSYEDNIVKDKEQLNKIENDIDNMEKQLRSNHIKRLSTGKTTTAYGSVVFLDIISNLERIGDHSVNIAESV